LAPPCDAVPRKIGANWWRFNAVSGGTEKLTASMLTTTGVAPYRKVQDLAPKLRCRECDKRGKALVSAKLEGARPLGAYRFFQTNEKVQPWLVVTVALAAPLLSTLPFMM
jgi:hypothetical protein